MKMRPENREELDRLHGFLQTNRQNLAAIDQVAMHLQRKSYPLANVLQAYDNYLTSQPASSRATFNHAWYLARDGQFEAAIRKYRRALELGIKQPEEVHLNIASIFMDHLQDNESARTELERSLALNPRYAAAFHNLGNLAEQLGDRDEAAACFQMCLDIDPANESALARLGDTHRFTEGSDPLLIRMKTAAETSANSDLHFALGSAFDQLTNFEQAWRHFSKANELDRMALPGYDRDKSEAFFNRIIELCGPKWFDGIQGISSDPVFICGMFRTGSTLLEQIFAAHPRFTAGGESEFFPRLIAREFHNYPDGLDEITFADIQTWRESAESHLTRMTNGLTRCTDKRPDNFLNIGLIKAVLPGARFVVTERDWRDVALSIFSTRLGPTQTYSNELSNIHHYIGQQKRLVDHWKLILGDDLIRVSYEDLIGHPKQTIEKLLKALGEDWDDRCLKFDQLDNPVKTASVWQVREPLHSRSIGRWKNYQLYFEEVFGSGGCA